MSIQRLSVLVLISKQQCALACTARVAAPLHHSRHGAQAASCFCRQASCRCAARHPHSASCHSACRQRSCSGRADQRKTAGCLSQHRQPARQPRDYGALSPEDGRGAAPRLGQARLRRHRGAHAPAQQAVPHGTGHAERHARDLAVAVPGMAAGRLQGAAATQRHAALPRRRCSLIVRHLTKEASERARCSSRGRCPSSPAG